MYKIYKHAHSKHTDKAIGKGKITNIVLCLLEEHGKTIKVTSIKNIMIIISSSNFQPFVLYIPVTS